MNRIGSVQWALLGILLTAALSGCGTGSLWVDTPGQQEFQQRLGTANQPVLAEFYQTACEHCWLLAPMLTQLSEDYRGRVTFLKVEYSQDGALFAQYGIKGTPTVLLFVNGVERNRWVGEGNKDVYSKALDQALGAQPHRR